MRILFAENHRAFRDIVIAQFMRDHDVSCVESIVAARQMAASTRFDCLLVDYDLDDGRGNELIRWFRATSIDGIIIGVSSHAIGNAALLAAGADGVCSKMHFDEIGGVIENALRLRS